MEKTTITKVTLDEARELYNSHNKTLKELALKCFSENELKLPSFSEIKTFEDAVKALEMDIDDTKSIIDNIKKTSSVSAAMYKLNLVRKALNLGQDLKLAKNTEDSCIYYPYNPLTDNGSNYFRNAIKYSNIEVIGKIRSDETEYNVLGNSAVSNCGAGLSVFYYKSGFAQSDPCTCFLGCANKEIAQHFGKYFGMLITAAKYSYLSDFEVIEDKYGNV